MRKRSEIDLNKYNQIVIADDDTPSEGHEYKSEYRGKVQNRSVEIAFLPMYQMSYLHQVTVGADRAFDKDIEELNRLSKSEKPIFLSCSPSQMTEQQSLSMFNYIDKLSKSISNVKDVDVMSRRLMLRAIAYSALQDFESAISDLTAVIQMNDRNKLAYWQRAVCEEMQFNYNASQGISNQLIAGQTRADFDDAIRLNPNNPYLYYNRGNMHASRKEYSQAIDDYSKAIELDSRMAEAWYNRGIARIKSQNKTQGVSDLSKAGELGLFDAYSIIKRITVK
jgi:tetratricopeptide (TPR) repeat protein